MTLLVLIQWSMAAGSDQCPLDKQPSRNWPGMQIGPICSKMYSNLRFHEVAGVDGRLFATGGDEGEGDEWGVVLISSQRDGCTLPDTIKTLLIFA